MKSLMRNLIVLLFVSIVLHVTGIAAKTIEIIVAIDLPSWAGERQIATLQKTVDGPERLTLSSYFDRNLKARVVANDGIFTGNSGWAWTFNINNNNYTTIYLGDNGYSASSMYTYFTGSKTLYLKTTVPWIDATRVNGEWYVNG